MVLLSTTIEELEPSVPFYYLVKVVYKCDTVADMVSKQIWNSILKPNTFGVKKYQNIATEAKQICLDAIRNEIA